MKIQIKFDKKIETHKKIIEIINEAQEFYNEIEKKVKWLEERGILEVERIKNKINNWLEEWKKKIMMMAPDRDLWCSNQIIKIMSNYWDEFIKIQNEKNKDKVPKLINNLTKTTRKKLNFQLKKELKI